MRKQAVYPLTFERELQYDNRRVKLLEGDGAGYRLACMLHDMCVAEQFKGDEPAPLYVDMAYNILVDDAARRQIKQLIYEMDVMKMTTVPRAE
jgi:hypothetical protein